MTGILAIPLIISALHATVVIQPVVNMYKAPTTDASVESQAIYGTNVDSLEQTEGWVRIRTADEYTGWTPLSGLQNGRPYATQGRVAEVQSLSAHLYRVPDVKKHAPMITLPFETKLEVIAEPVNEDPAKERWMQVRLPNERTAWVQYGDVAFDVKPLNTAQMLAYSKRFVGLPYTWGGASSFGYDCSGFVQMLCRRCGVKVPRDAYQQAKWDGLALVDRKDLAPGDLLYFGQSPSNHRITHTGIYLGDGKFISATTNKTPTIHVDDLDDLHWAGRLAVTRRMK